MDQILRQLLIQKSVLFHWFKRTVTLSTKIEKYQSNAWLKSKKQKKKEKKGCIEGQYAYYGE
jgi:hypothetical protein